MNYNQTQFYHASPFYKQDYLPDRAWYNRQARGFPSEMPSGKDFLPDIGRKHYQNKFNHSEIQDDSVLKSPERFPFENRIAMEKTYMRSLNTIDIEGASSNSKVNQSIKNKYKARDQLSRKHDLSVEVKGGKTEEEKRRDAAVQYYRTKRTRESTKHLPVDAGEGGRREGREDNNPESRPSPSIKKDLSGEYKRFVMQNSSNKFHKDIATVKDPHSQSPSHSHGPQHGSHQRYHTLNAPSLSMQYEASYRPNLPNQETSYRPNLPNQETSQRTNLEVSHRTNQETSYRTNQERSSSPQPQPIQKQQQSPGQRQQQQQPSPRHAPAMESRYKSEFNGQKLRNIDEYHKILMSEYSNRSILKNPHLNSTRQANPTNLSLSFAGKSIALS